jgi:hypothetical protein
MEEQSRQYELTEADRSVIGGVASNMRAAGVLMLVYGAGFLLMGILALAGDGREGWGSVLQGALFLLIGLWTLQAGLSFARVSGTRTPAPGDLRTALAKLLRIYQLQKWLMVLGIVLFLVICFGTFFLIFCLPRIQYHFAQ